MSNETPHWEIGDRVKLRADYVDNYGRNLNPGDRGTVRDVHVIHGAEIAHVRMDRRDIDKRPEILFSDLESID